ncbi:MAG: hypothetical protein Q4F97_00110 [Bacteroidales bacterium]|nr:hypothetical protein [Bacteroidales bacterium]
MNLNVDPQKTKEMVDRYNNDSQKGDMSRRQYAVHLSKNDPAFVPWLFNFEQNEQRSDISTGMTREVNTALDNWIDIYDNY